MPGNNTLALNGRSVRCILFDCGETLWTFPGQTIWQSMQNNANQRAITLLHHYIDQAEAKATLAPDKPYSVDEHLIPYAHKRSADYGRPLSSETAQPGIIIEHLSELLDIFLEAGKQ